MPALRKFYNVASAAAYLDRRDPEWYKRVTATVRMAEPELCVAGQNAAALGTNHGWYCQLESWGIDPGTWKGSGEWNIDGAWQGEGEWNIWATPRFDGAWQNEIDRRRVLDDIRPTPESERVTILAGNSVYEVDRTFDGLMRLLSHLDVDLKEREVTKL